jgi:hypothetical protein
MKIRYLTANAHRKLKGGVLATHANHGIYHLAVKNDVRALEINSLAPKL